MEKKFKLNCDVGEQIGHDEFLMPYLDTCSIACGGHAGNTESMKLAIDLALKHSVSVGAHPSYPDRENFGRNIMKISPYNLIESIKQQVDSLENICNQLGAQIGHIKAHGALYNQAAKDEKIAMLILDASDNRSEIPLYTPWNSVLYKLAKKAGRKVITEAFADRRYNKDLSLVSRAFAESVISVPGEAKDQVRAINEKEIVKTIDSEYVQMKAQTFCVHGDNPNAEEILKVLKSIQFHG